MWTSLALPRVPDGNTARVVSTAETPAGGSMKGLTTSQVAHIKYRLLHSIAPQDELVALLACEYGVSELTIRRIATGYSKRLVSPMKPTEDAEA